MKHFGLKAHLFPLSEGLGEISKQKSMILLKPMGEGKGKVGVTWRFTKLYTFIWRHIRLKFHYLARCRHLNSFDINTDITNTHMCFPRTTDLLVGLVSLQSWYIQVKYIRHLKTATDNLFDGGLQQMDQPFTFEPNRHLRCSIRITGWTQDLQLKASTLIRWLLTWMKLKR